MESAQDKYKWWGIAFLIFLLILIPIEISILKNKPGIKKSNSIPKSNVEISEAHPKLYYVDFEYDPLTKKTARLDSGLFNGDQEQLDASPSLANYKFSYKVETFSEKGDLLLSGWISVNKFVITTDSGKYKFRVNVPYVSGETLNIASQENETIWTGKII